VFPAPGELRRHEEGEHPKCEFCLVESAAGKNRKKNGGGRNNGGGNNNNNNNTNNGQKLRFYDLDSLHSHLRSHHEKCYVCARTGLDNQYYRGYPELERHFDRAHHLCKHPACREIKHVVFGDEIDLRAHEIEAHGGSYNTHHPDQQSSTKIKVAFRVRRAGRGGTGVDGDDGNLLGNNAVAGGGADIGRENFEFGLDGRPFVPPERGGGTEGIPYPLPRGSRPGTGADTAATALSRAGTARMSSLRTTTTPTKTVPTSIRNTGTG